MLTLDHALLGVMAGSLGAAAWLLLKERSSGKGQLPSLPAPAAPQPPSCPAGWLPVLSADDLFREVQADPLLFRIRQSLGFAPENYAVDVAPLLNRVAEYIQLLPASESHHHANPGGLLTHLLEVAVVALLRAEETKLPVGRPTEEQLKFAARWRYGILVAALLHDIGKPVADVLVDVRRSDGMIGRWNGLGGCLADYGDCYRVQFPLRHDYGAHQRLPVMLLKSFLPAGTMQWLADDTELVQTLIAYLSGESDGGVIGKLIKAADGKSVADNLLHGNRTRFATARQVPLIERVMDAMRRMLTEGGHLPLNREGAVGFCDGKDLWFVAGTLADKVRAWLDENEIREIGAAGLPSDNSRLFDTWLDYAAIRENAGAAIWKAKVSLSREGLPWTQTFTMLRFPLEKLYPEPEAYPQALSGTIEVVQGVQLATIESEAVDATDAAKSEATALPPAATMSEGAPATNEAALDPIAIPSPEDFALTPVSLEELSAQPFTAVDEFLDPEDSAVMELRAPIPAPPTAAAAAVPDEPTAPVMPLRAKPPRESIVGEDVPQPDREIERLMAWIQQGVADGSLHYNRATACVHFVKEGMLLISPKVFREFFLATGVEIDGGGTQLKRIQKLLQKSGYVAKNKPNSFLHNYRITNAKNPERSLVTGYLVADPGLFFRDMPEANPHLEASAGNRGT